MSDLIDRVRALSQIDAGSEDDLILKIVIPFFRLFGYETDQFEIKYPISCYRPGRTGRKPEADCVFFASADRHIDTALLVVEAKRVGGGSPETQARFYSANLFVPFYITWENDTFEIFQLHAFRSPRSIATFSLNNLTAGDLADIRAMLAPRAIVDFCNANEIKCLHLDDKRRETEGRYADQLQKSLRIAKILDFSRAIDLLHGYVPLYLQELATDAIAPEDVEQEIEKGFHPKALESARRLEPRRSLLLSEALDRHSTIAVIGDPGSGKTTLLKNLCLQYCFSDTVRVPVFVAIRELVATGENVRDGIRRQIRRHGDTSQPDMLLEHALSEGRLLLCVDGLDELDIRDPTEARKALRALSGDLADVIGANSRNLIVISARRESWPTCRPEIPPNFHEYELQPLSTMSTRNFVVQWFGDRDAEMAMSLLDQFRLHAWPEFSSNPLLLALTCIVYEKRRRLPDRSTVLCQRCIDVLLEEWDATRRISRRQTVASLTPERKHDILSELALSFHSKQRACFEREDVVRELEIQLPRVGLDPSEAGAVFEEITTQHGLLRSWSIEGLYAFPHLVFQEFLAAKALRDRPTGFEDIVEKRDDPFWREPLLMYAGIGAATQLVDDLLRVEDNVLHASLFLAAESLSTGAKILDVGLRSAVLERLGYLLSETLRI